MTLPPPDPTPYFLLIPAVGLFIAGLGGLSHVLLIALGLNRTFIFRAYLLRNPEQTWDGFSLYPLLLLYVGLLSMGIAIAFTVSDQLLGCMLPFFLSLVLLGSAAYYATPDRALPEFWPRWHRELLTELSRDDLQRLARSWYRLPKGMQSHLNSSTAAFYHWLDLMVLSL